MKRDEVEALIKETAEELGWWCEFREQSRNDTDERERYVEFGQFSPAGQDFSFYVFFEELDEIPYKVYQYWEDYDIEEEVEMWLEAKRNGVSGVPSVVILVQDQQEIEDMIERLFWALKGKMDKVEIDLEVEDEES